MYNKPSEHHPGITPEAPCRNLRNNRNQAAICTKIFRTSWNHCGNRTRTHTGTYTGNHHARTSRTTRPERLEPPPRNPLRKLPETRTGTSQSAHPHRKLHRAFIWAVTPKPTLLGEITLLYTRWYSVETLAFFGGYHTQGLVPSIAWCQWHQFHQWKRWTGHSHAPSGRHHGPCGVPRPSISERTPTRPYLEMDHMTPPPKKKKKRRATPPKIPSNSIPTELRMKVAVVMLATALANIVFPVPGGP